MAILKEGEQPLRFLEDPDKKETQRRLAHGLLTALGTVQYSEVGRREIRIGAETITIESIAKELYNAFEYGTLFGIQGDELRHRVINIDVSPSIRSMIKAPEPNQSFAIEALRQFFCILSSPDQQRSVSPQDFRFYIQLFGIEIPSSMQLPNWMTDESAKTLTRLYELHHSYPIGLYVDQQYVFYNGSQRDTKDLLGIDRILVLGRCGSDEDLLVRSPNIFRVLADT